LQFRKLKEDSNAKKTARVIRGEEKVIPLQELTVGDVVRIHSGDKVPADGLLIPGLDGIFFSTP
jgi:P-type E1-E2 ATPase